MPIGDLELGLTVAPSSSTGADIMDAEFDFGFGDIIVGSDGKNSTWVSGLLRDITVGLIVALAAKYAWGKIK